MVQQPSPTRRRRLLVIGLLLAMAAALLTFVGVWRRDRALLALERKLQAEGGDVALKEADAYLAWHPGNQRALVVRAQALVQLQRWDEANAVFSQTGARSSTELLAWATALVHSRRYDEALPPLAQLVQREPNRAEALQLGSTCKFQLGDTAAALTDAKRLARLPGHEVEGEFLCGVIHRFQGRTDLAVQNWTRIESIRPQADGLPICSDEFYLTFAEDLLSVGMPRSALIRLKRCSDSDRNPLIHLRSARAWATIGETSQAAAAWKQVLAMEPDHREALIGLAELALERLDADAAIKLLEPLTSLGKLEPSIAYVLERAYTLLTDEKQRAHWQREAARLQTEERQRTALKRKLRQGTP